MKTSHSDYPFDLGTHCPAFVVTNDEAAAWFATRLSWLYGFNHEEAIGCFQNAARADDGFALAGGASSSPVVPPRTSLGNG